MVWVRVRLGSGLATAKGWVGTCPVNRLDPDSSKASIHARTPHPYILAPRLFSLPSTWGEGKEPGYEDALHTAVPADLYEFSRLRKGEGGGRGGGGKARFKRGLNRGKRFFKRGLS